MAKRTTSLPCTAENCGDLFPKCGRPSTYTHGKCRCDVCHEHDKQRRFARREAKAEYDRQYREANIEKKLAYDKRYHADNRDKIAEYHKRHYSENRDAARESRRIYYRENSAAGVERARQWKLANPERVREIGRSKQHRRRARMKAAQVVPFTPEQERQKMAYYGNSCYLKLPGICTGGFDEVDHVKPIAKGGAHMIANMRPACLPCNRIKWAHWPFKFAA